MTSTHALTSPAPRRVAMSGTASAVLGGMGLLASLSGFCTFFGMVFGLAGLLLGGICARWGRRSAGSAKRSVPGLLLSALAVTIALGWVGWMIFCGPNCA